MNDEQSGPSVEEQWQAIGQAVQTAAEHLGQMAHRLFDAFREAMDTPEGRMLIAAGRYLEEHPEYAAELRAANRRAESCHCLCGRWKHLGTCAGEATTSRTFFAESTGVVEVPLCVPCAADQDLKAALAR